MSLIKKIKLGILSLSLTSTLFVPTLVSGQEVELDVAAIEVSYDSAMWDEIITTYMEDNPNVKINLIQEKELEDAITPRMQGGDFPDVVFLPLQRQKALTETLLKDNAITELTEVLDMQIPGEEITVGEKMLEGFIGSTSTNPYADERVFLLPLFYHTSGLFYDANLFDQKGWDVPETWDQMWALGDEVQGEYNLFSYPRAGYFDTTLHAMLYTLGGEDLHSKAMTYDPSVWKEDLNIIFETWGKLSEYVDEVTVAYGTPTDAHRNIQQLLDHKVLFLPHLSGVYYETEDQPKADGFEFGLMPVPGWNEGDQRYSYTFMEHIWIPEAAEEKDAAKEFLAFLYSDRANEIFIEFNGIQPIQGALDGASPEQQALYGIFEDDVLPASGNFVSAPSIPGLNFKDVLYFPLDSLVMGEKTADEWHAEVVNMMEMLYEQSQ